MVDEAFQPFAGSASVEDSFKAGKDELQPFVDVEALIFVIMLIRFEPC